MRGAVKEIFKKIGFRYLRLGAPRYEYGLEPIQLMEIVGGLEKTIKGRKGANIVEVGVSRGITTRFICEHLIRQNHDATFYCLDTFGSFTKQDIAYEVENRGKKRGDLNWFAYNDYAVWKKNFAPFAFVKPIQCDASTFDFSTIAPIQFCLLDVDLYLPTKNVLRNIIPFMATDAVIVVDDVLDDTQWDGAYQAFIEFVNETKLKYRLVGNKCGIISL